MIDISSTGNDDLPCQILDLFIMNHRVDFPDGFITFQRTKLLHLSVLLCLGAIVLGETVQSTEEELDVDDPIVWGEESDPLAVEVLEGILFLYLLSSNCLGQNKNKKGEWE
jgi:hypothetical protein